MKSVRLTNSIREAIIKDLMKLPYEKFKNSLKEIGELCDSILIGTIDKEILEIDEKYPMLIDKIDRISFNAISINEKSLYHSIKVNNWYRCYNDKNLKFVKDDKRIQDFCKKVISLNEEIKILENKIACLLYHIHTTKQLKDQFPEAYNAFLKLNQEENSDNLCDSFENVRATFSKFNKE